MAACTKINIPDVDAKRRRATGCACRMDWLEKPTRRMFGHLGRYIAKHPYPFFLFPLIISGCLGYGLRHLQLETDTEYLVTPKNGAAKAERNIVKDHFVVDQAEEFWPERSHVLDGFTDVIITGRNGNDMLTPERLQIVFDIDKKIRNITAKDDEGNSIQYEGICAKWQHSCFPNPMVAMYKGNASLVALFRPTFPKFNYMFLGNTLGGVITENNTGIIETAQSVRMTFYVRYDTEAEKELANRWFIAVKEFLNEYNDEEVIIYHSATNSLEEQFNEASEDIIPKFAAPFVLLITFSIASCMMSDWVRSKPWLALGGVMAAGLALLTVFGFLSAVGVRAVPQVGLVPFLTLGVGVDNMFILISAWRRATVDENLGLDMRRRVELRMGEALAEAALSITITTLTDVLAFGIGAITDFVTVELFCLYTGMSIVCSYIYCLTFFAAIMVFSGWREESNRHCFSLARVQSKKEAEDRSWWYRICCAGGTPGHGDKAVRETKTHFLPKDNELNLVQDSSDHIIMKFFRDFVGKTLMNPWIKAVIITIYLGYLAIAIFGCTQMRTGVSFEKLSNVDSYLANYYHYKDVYYNKYGPAVSIVITNPMDYSDLAVQANISDTIKLFEDDTDFFTTDDTHSWLRDYLMFLKQFPMQPRNEEEFVQILNQHFLTHPGFARYKLDVSFNANKTRIMASRFYVQSKWFAKTEDMMLEARRLAKVAELPITIFHQTFIYFDQPIVVLENTLQNIFIAVICMFVVALLFVPHAMCAVWVTVATASIECGVIGYMTLWDVNVDFISMTYLILCIGFSVDFAVHITYGFIASPQKRGSDKAVDALYILGYPVMQSGISTILGVIFLCTSISYLFLSFFKTMMLVIVFGVFHAIFVLPVILSLCHGTCKGCESEACTDCCHDCKEEIKEQKHQITEKGKHIYPLLFKECEQCCNSEMSSVVGDGPIYHIAEKCSVV